MSEPGAAVLGVAARRRCVGVDVSTVLDLAIDIAVILAGAVLADRPGALGRRRRTR